jgi:hypothetical protein
MQKQYAEVRDTIRTGDCIQWKSKGLIPRIIRLWSEYSHSSLVVRFDKYEDMVDRVFLIEALSGGLTMTLLSKRIQETKGTVFLFQVNNHYDDSEAAIRRDASVALAHGIKYDYKSLFMNMMGRVSNDASRYFCSEFVWEKWRKSGMLRGNMTALGLKMLEKKRAPRPGDIPLWVHGKTTELLS